ncbi:unnamed protein product [Pedinophyceae sp. YPF-701]|nr:unnamed protein product [Pedinophyceae sp. YPF-701]
MRSSLCPQAAPSGARLQMGLAAHPAPHSRLLTRPLAPLPGLGGSRGRHARLTSRKHDEAGRRSAAAQDVRIDGLTGQEDEGSKNGGSVVSNGAALNGSTNGATATVDAVVVNGNGAATISPTKPASENGAAASKKSKVPKVLETVADESNGATGSPYRNPGGKWNRFKGYSTWQRTLEIWTFAFSFLFRYWRIGRAFHYKKKGGMTKENVSAERRKVAVWLREGLVRLGPTFIKIGQQFSTRVDVLAKEFIEELEKLQDNVPPFDWESARAILNRSIGRPVEEVFESFDTQPIAAASLGQVHLAVLNGTKVVVKVQRPGLRELFDIDLKNVRVLAQWLQKVDPKTDGAKRDWVAIYDECSRVLYEEIDYQNEARNAQRFSDNFKDVDWVKVPKILWDYTTPQTMVMEYMPGIKINRGDELVRAGVDKDRIARLAVESYLMQILRHGFFHADPHPGNVSVDPADGGRLIYYDFGMMGALKTDVRAGLLNLFYGTYEKDADKCLDALIQMGVLVPTTNDRTAIRRTAEFFLSSFQNRLDEQKEAQSSMGKDKYEAQGFKGERSKDEKKQRRKQILEAIGEDLLSVADEQPFRFPAEFTFAVRSFTVLDGIGKALNSRFDITEISAPYARGLLLESQPFLKKYQEDLGRRAGLQARAVKNLFTGPNQIEDIANFTKRLENGDLKLRVRAFEAERALQRSDLMQDATVKAVLASAAANVGTVLAVSAIQIGANVAFGVAGLLGISAGLTMLKVQKLRKKELSLKGRA